MRFFLFFLYYVPIIVIIRTVCILHVRRQYHHTSGEKYNIYILSTRMMIIATRRACVVRFNRDKCENAQAQSTG